MNKSVQIYSLAANRKFEPDAAVEKIAEKDGDYLFASTSIGRLVISSKSRYASKCDKITILNDPKNEIFSFSYYNQMLNIGAYGLVLFGL